MSESIPVIGCGKRVEIFKGFAEHMIPEFEVVHSILSVEQGQAELPALLSGGPPPADSGFANHGTGNYTRAPVAVLTGGGWDDEAFAALRASCLGVSTVPWLRPDMTNMSVPFSDPGYVTHLTGRAKECLKKLAEGGQLGMDGIYYF